MMNVTTATPMVMTMTRRATVVIERGELPGELVDVGHVASVSVLACLRGSTGAEPPCVCILDPWLTTGSRSLGDGMSCVSAGLMR